MMPRWSILATIYVAWVLIAALSNTLFTNPVLYDYSYWLGERIFVVAAFYTALICVEKKYKGIIKLLLVVAIWKFIYLVLVIAGVIQLNDYQDLMALIFLVTVSVIILKWEKLRK